MSSLYVYLRIVSLIFNNMTKNRGPAGNKVYFSSTKSKKKFFNIAGAHIIKDSAYHRKLFTKYTPKLLQMSNLLCYMRINLQGPSF